MKRAVAMLIATMMLAGTLLGCDAKASLTPSGEAPSGSGVVEYQSENYADAARLAVEVAAGVQALAQKLAAEGDDVLRQDDPASYREDPAYLGNATLAPLQSQALALTVPLTEGEEEATLQQTLDDAFKAAGYAGGATVTRNAANDYTIAYEGSYTDEATGDVVTAPCELAAQFSPETGALRLVVYAEAEDARLQLYFYEFVPLGEGRYAYQTDTERAVVTCQGKTPVAFSYARGAYSTLLPYVDAERDSIYPDAEGVGEDWVWLKGGLQQVIEYRDGTLWVELAATLFDTARRAVLGQAPSDDSRAWAIPEEMETEPLPDPEPDPADSLADDSLTDDSLADDGAEGEPAGEDASEGAQSTTEA